MQEAKHILFIDSDDEDQLIEGNVHPNLLPEPVTSIEPSSLELVSSISTDFDSKDQCYVLQVVHIPAAALVAATLSNRRVKLFSLKEADLQFSGELSGHTGRITDAHASVPDEPHILHTASADGTVRGWDLRTGATVELYSAANMEVACCSSNGTLLAAGAKDRVLFWDRRTRKPAAIFTDTHAQDVTQVRFHPTVSSALLSGSEDGLIAVFDVASALDEDEGFKAGLNIDTAVARFGFYGNHGGKLWCCSGTETVHLWDWTAACDDERVGGNGPLGVAHNAREQLDIGDKKADYLIQCDYEDASDSLFLAAGTCAGAAGTFVVPQPPGGAAVALDFLPAINLMHGGHSDIVRSMAYISSSTNPLWVTGGEDSRMCVWSRIGVAADEGGDGRKSTTDCARRRDQSHMRRASPY